MFHQHAVGNFSVEVGGQYHCGPDHISPKQLVFEVRIEYPDNALDSHGFLVDNLEFHNYFNNLHYTEDSCELVAKKAADYFCGKAPNAIRVHVDISVPGLADIEYEEKPADSRPLAVQLQGAPLTMGDL